MGSNALTPMGDRSLAEGQHPVESARLNLPSLPDRGAIGRTLAGRSDGGLISLAAGRPPIRHSEPQLPHSQARRHPPEPVMQRDP